MSRYPLVFGRVTTGYSRKQTDGGLFSLAFFISHNLSKMYRYKFISPDEFGSEHTSYDYETIIVYVILLANITNYR